MASTFPIHASAKLSFLPGQDLVVMTTELAGHRSLAQNAVPQAEVLLLHQEQDGIAAIAQQLAALPSIRRLHLVTPGNASGLPLGKALLRANNLPSYARTLNQWRSHLAPSAEILIYNGEMSRTEAGKLLIDVLHHLTGAAIAACITPPSAIAANGRWELDCTNQSFEPVLAFPPAVVAQIQSQFPPKLGQGRAPGEGSSDRLTPISCPQRRWSVTDTDYPPPLVSWTR